VKLSGLVDILEAASGRMARGRQQEARRIELPVLRQDVAGQLEARHEREQHRVRGDRADPCEETMTLARGKKSEGVVRALGMWLPAGFNGPAAALLDRLDQVDQGFITEKNIIILKEHFNFIKRIQVERQR
jgi:hypothetical protein